MKNTNLLIGMAFLGISINSTAAPPQKKSQTVMNTQPTTCVTGEFTQTGSSDWYNIALKLTNNCNSNLDFRNVTVTFNNKSNLNTDFWGDFAPLQYPDNQLKITSKQTSPGNYLSSLSFHIPEESWAQHILPATKSITLRYGAPTATQESGSVKVYLAGNVEPPLPPINGSIKVDVGPLPNELSGYNQTPSIVFTRPDTNASLTYNVPWNTVSSVNTLEDKVTYNLTTSTISFNGTNCTGSLAPSALQSSSSSPLTSKLTYNCVKQALINVPVNITGLPTTVSNITLTFTPANGSQVISKVIPVSDGKGTAPVGLVQGVTYTVSSSSISGYSALFSPQPLTVNSSVALTATYQKQQAGTGGRVMAYIPGWKTPPSATSLASSGHTHVFIAFGVFSTTSPGEIVPAFDTVSKAYIAELHQAGIKVILSLGGASTSIPNTSVDFHQVLSLSNPTTFQNTFVNSVKKLVADYGFDGIDIDIEHGLGPKTSSTFASPDGDIAVMANILKTLHNDNPNLLLTLTPQVANISATSGFDGTWGNYASLIMQTAEALSWVGIQVYNTGCAYGIDHVCYADASNSPDLSVAMAVDILENWPQKDASGRATGFQPYISRLTPNQAVLGYPAPNRQGVSDGLPAKPTAVIKRAIQCLKTATKGPNSCDQYVPPRAYGNIGGVFEWEATYDQDNNFQFAKDLKPCVVDGNC